MWRQRAGSGNTTSIQCRHQKPSTIRVWRPHRQEGELKEEEPAVLRQHQVKIRSERSGEKNREGAGCESLTWTFCVQRCHLLLPLKGFHSLSRLRCRTITTFALCLLRISIHNPAFYLSASKGLKSQQREPSSHRQHVPCYCHLSLHAVDSAEYCCRVRRAHRLHEHRLARWIPPCIRCSFRPPWGHHSRRGLQAHFRHLWSLYKTASTAGNTVRTVRSPLWRDCQRVLAGYFYLPGCRDPVAVCRGIHFRLHHVLSKHHEEEHL